MIYKHLSIETILSKIKEKYTEKEMQNYAYELVSGLADNMDDFDEDTDFVAFLAEYFSTGEYKEWLYDTFLADEDEVYINCDCGNYRCVNKWDCDLGSIIDIYDVDDNCVGFIRGNLNDFTEEKLIEEVEDEMENHWSDTYLDDEDNEEWDD